MCQVVQEWRQIGGEELTRGLEPPNTMQEYKEIYVCVCLFAKLTPKSDPGSTKPSFVPMEYFQSFLFFGLLEFVDDRL